MHTSSGAIIKNDKNEVLMIDRKIEPFGWACPAGHVDLGESPDDAMVREVHEETGLSVTAYDLIYHEFVPWNTCSHGVEGHDWYVFFARSFTGNVKIEKNEVKQYQWIPIADVPKMNLEKVWEHWHKKELFHF